MSFLEGLKKSFSKFNAYDQYVQNDQKPEMGDGKGGFDHIDHFGVRSFPEKTHHSPSPAQQAHTLRMVVDCPTAKGLRVHCWHCSRCGEARKCAAWRHRRSDVEFFRSSGEPYSLILAEGIGAARPPHTEAPKEPTDIPI